MNDSIKTTDTIETILAHAPLDKPYQPEAIEMALYSYWEQRGYFKCKINSDKPPFCIMLPPPNVTGDLHMGHAFQQTIMDILIRYHRMQGKNVFWQVGTDHAGIATQLIVENKLLREAGKTRHDYGREQFLEKVWQWKAESGSNITQQMCRLGSSADWDSARFTMDEALSAAVKAAFIHLHQSDLIYRGKRLVNWDSALGSAISDLEVENREEQGTMWYIRYELADGAKTATGESYLTVATTRPETLLGDTAIAVHPEHPKYQALIGKQVYVPIINRRIPIIGDEHADISKGTGCVKITPAHDFNDYAVGKRHHLPMVNIFTSTATLRAEAEVFTSKGESLPDFDCTIPTMLQGMERFAARKKIIHLLEQSGTLEKAQPHLLTLPYGDRSGVIIEPLLTNQWYVRMAPLAAPAITAVERGDIEFVPSNYVNMYSAWMHQIEDWCISRQLWWGHRIPAWYDDAGNIYVGYDEATVRQKYQLQEEIKLYQDEDVLDTWFSSALWTFSTLGWPQQTEMLHTFHPTSVMVSGFDIIFFWIARMIMCSLYLLPHKNGQPQIPFKQVYITGLIRDEKGQKMSKSKGNVFDPIDMIDGISLESLIKKRTLNLMQPKQCDEISQRTRALFPQGIPAHGVDALRFTLAALACHGRDINWDMKRLEGYRHFCNKLWNASRFVLMHTVNETYIQSINSVALSLPDRWIISLFQHSVIKYRQALDDFRFDIAAQILYEFVWHQFCDWYLEMTKPFLFDKTRETATCGTRYTLITILEATLRLAHPIIPFISEILWQYVKKIKNITIESIMLAPFPQPELSQIDEIALQNIEWIKTIIITIRNLRAEGGIPAGKKIAAIFIVPDTEENIKNQLQQHEPIIRSLANLESITLQSTKQSDKAAGLCAFVHPIEIVLPLASLIDKEKELQRLTKHQQKIATQIAAHEAKLANTQFIAQAPTVVVEQARQQLATLYENMTQLQQRWQEINAL